MKKNKKPATLAQRINVLRASVMGANDGILSVAGIVVGVAGAATSSFAIFISGIAGMIAGTVSMAMGEYVSVNTQKDAQRKAIETQTTALDDDYQGEVDFIREKYIASGIKPELAAQATKEMMASDPVKASVRERFGFNVGEYTNPFSAAIASMISFPTGSILPLVSISLLPKDWRILGTFIAVVIALSITGYVAATLGNANRRNGTMRNVIAGILTMLVTYGIGHLFA
ncbi:VIT1/CCC1 transporter family protein [Levilactobacillus yonginensis]|uniref:VIT1/CCC1 transporter family protein n=1 Tax=Levilactobacillus yonginensis TaxID=1054041 RepID=UPI000F7A5E26|nr:VIT family protein [Levilactobacillus yonginensis]